jgi:hypothetical protein
MCDECLAIARLLKEVTPLSSNRAPEEARLAVGALPGGAEEDMLRAEALLPDLSKFTRALNMKLTHERLTGHKVSWR